MSKKNPISLKKIARKRFVSVTSQSVSKAESSKNPEFCRKNHVSYSKTYSYSERMVKKYDRQQDSNTQPFGFLTVVPPRISIVKGSKDSADKKFERDG